MKNNKNHLIKQGVFCLLLLLPFTLKPQTQSSRFIQITGLSMVLDQGLATLEFTLRTKPFDIPGYESLALDFWIETTVRKEKTQIHLPQVLYTGRQRYLQDERMRAMQGQEATPTYHIYKGKQTQELQPLKYRVTFPYQSPDDQPRLCAEALCKDGYRKLSKGKVQIPLRGKIRQGSIVR